MLLLLLLCEHLLLVMLLLLLLPSEQRVQITRLLALRLLLHVAIQ